MEDTTETEATTTDPVTTTRIILVITRGDTTGAIIAEADTAEVGTTTGTTEATRRGVGAMTIISVGAEREEAGEEAATGRSTGETGAEATTEEEGAGTPGTATGITGTRVTVTGRILDTTKRTQGPATLLLMMNPDMVRMKTPETEAARVRTSHGRRERLGLMTWSLVIRIEG